ncbi:MAG: serine protease [bacterium]|nr:serine protease [bacterium]
MKKLIILIIASFFLFSVFGVKAAPGATIGAPRSVEELLGVDGKYDAHSVLLGAAGLEKLEAIAKSLPQIEVKFKVKLSTDISGTKEEVEREIRQRVTGTVFGRYLLTVAHVTKIEPPVIQTSFGPVTLQMEVLEKKFFVSFLGQTYPLKEVKIDISQDWALFELPEEAKGKCPAPRVGKSSELKPGHFLYLVGSPYKEGAILRSGIVESLSANLEDGSKAISPEDVFALSGGIYPGDSGGQVFALRDGQLELVGMMVVTKLYTTIGYALKVEPLLEKVKAATGIDLRKQ